jgi:CubicO group peptidase (beta-lactamase class C family)
MKCYGNFVNQLVLFQPGAQWSYSNPGAEILGRLLNVR